MALRVDYVAGNTGEARRNEREEHGIEFLAKSHGHRLRWADVGGAGVIRGGIARGIVGARRHRRGHLPVVAHRGADDVIAWHQAEDSVLADIVARRLPSHYHQLPL